MEDLRVFVLEDKNHIPVLEASLEFVPKESSCVSFFPDSILTKHGIMSHLSKGKAHNFSHWIIYIRRK